MIAMVCMGVFQARNAVIPQVDGAVTISIPWELRKCVIINVQRPTITTGMFAGQHQCWNNCK